MPILFYFSLNSLTIGYEEDSGTLFLEDVALISVFCIA
jgi:hypothetical protein